MNEFLRNLHVAWRSTKYRLSSKLGAYALSLTGFMAYDRPEILQNVVFRSLKFSLSNLFEFPMVYDKQRNSGWVQKGRFNVFQSHEIW